MFPAVLLDFYMLESMKVFKESGDIAGIVEDRIQTVYQAFTAVYTDGSKDPKTGRTGFAFSCPSLNIFNNRRTSDLL